jgi:hypothetical protein
LGSETPRNALPEGSRFSLKSEAIQLQIGPENTIGIAGFAGFRSQLRKALQHRFGIDPQ